MMDLSAAAPAGSSGEDEVQPVYPPLDGPAEPLAEKLCDIVHTMAEERRAACCSSNANKGFASECTRVLTYALRTKTVEIRNQELDLCKEDMARYLEGCDWVTSLSPLTPPACKGLVHGLLTIGAHCRSSLECQNGLRCHGVGPTVIGVCGIPKEQGSCALSVDSLASFTRQDDYEKAHPECHGFCELHACRPRVQPGAPCINGTACGLGNHCENGRCVGGDGAKAGERCQEGRCIYGYQCSNNQCVLPLKEGEPCVSNAQCRGVCAIEPGGTHPTCSKQCAPLAQQVPQPRCNSQ